MSVNKRWYVTALRGGMVLGIGFGWVGQASLGMQVREPWRGLSASNDGNQVSAAAAEFLGLVDPGRIDILRPQHPASQVFANWFRGIRQVVQASGRYRASESGPTQEPVPVKSIDELKAAAYAELDMLAEKQGSLSREDTQPFWHAVRALYETGIEARPEVIGLYRSLSRLEVSAQDRLGICRYLGQDLMFTGNHDEAAAYFDQAEAVFDSASEADRRELASTMANILYLRGLVLRSTGQLLLLEENDRQLRDDPMMRASLEPETVLSILERTGDALYQRQAFGEAAECFAEALELLESRGSAESKRGHTIRISVKRTNASCSAREVEPAVLVGELDELATRFEHKEYQDFDLVLKELIVLHEKLGDQEKYQARLRQLCDWYLAEHSRLTLAGQPAEGARSRLFDAFGLLVRLLIDQAREEEAVAALRQCLKVATPPAHWLGLFPEELVRRATVELPSGTGPGSQPLTGGSGQ
jgi:tetratricopeptide (TPR) repeat protein